MSHVVGLNVLLRGREVLPEVRDAEDAVSAGEGGDDARLVVEVRLKPPSG
jgi:hypothetical protein